jgi:hypothetical protein
MSGTMGGTLTAAGGIRATVATDEHADAIAAFYREIWSQDATPESVRANRRQAAAENMAEPGEPPPTALVLDGSRVIGYCGSIPLRLWDGAVERPAYWTKGLMVLPEFRKGPIGFHVCKELAAHLPRALGLVVAPAARRLFTAVGYSDLGAIGNFVRLLRPAAVARELDVGALGLALPRWLTAAVRVAQRIGIAGLAGAGAGVAMDLAAATMRRTARGLTTSWSVDAPSEAELDAVWLSARDGLTASPVRDGRYLRSRFAAPDGTRDAPYVFCSARDAAQPLGVAVVRRPSASSDPRLRNVRVATLSDIVFPLERTDVGFALLAAVAQAARAAGADAILCSTSHPALARLLRRQAYVPLPGNVHVLLHDRTNATRWPRDLSAWWLARGDGEADEVF